MKTLKVSLVGIVGVSSVLTYGLVDDRRISMDQAQKIVQSTSSEFPITMNQKVLDQLNRYVSTPGGREFLRDSLKRMETFKPQIEPKISSYKVPKELIAIPIPESGFQNLPESNKLGHGAGLWMFIKSTARVYGMKVDKNIDERLDVDKETDAAMRYLKKEFENFGDWNLSVMAYNMGGVALKKAIQKTGSKDPWTLIEQGHENDKSYLAKVHAAMIILKNPSLVN